MFSYNMFPSLSLLEKALYLAQNMSEKGLLLLAILINEKHLYCILVCIIPVAGTFKAGYKNIVEI